jgi:hypothetical protein
LFSLIRFYSTVSILVYWHVVWLCTFVLYWLFVTLPHLMPYTLYGSMEINMNKNEKSEFRWTSQLCHMSWCTRQHHSSTHKHEDQSTERNNCYSFNSFELISVSFLCEIQWKGKVDIWCRQITISPDTPGYEGGW